MWLTLTLGDGIFDHKQMLSDRGFLVYIARAYPGMRPYLKGIHLTVDSWRPGRNQEGWKDPAWFGPYIELDEAHLQPPRSVRAVNRLAWDLRALLTLFDAVSPAVRIIRPANLLSVIYGFGDASGSGFGSSFTHVGGFLYRVGVWGSDADDESSNYRELRDLVKAVEVEAEVGNLSATELKQYFMRGLPQIRSCSIL